MKLLLALTVVFALGALASAHPTYYKLAENVTCESPPPIASYHIHILFWSWNNDSLNAALQLRQEFMDAWQDDLGAPCEGLFHQGRLCMFEVDELPAGPFTTGQWAVFVPLDYFASTVPWIMQRRGEFDLFVHPNTGCEVVDHTVWPVVGGTKWEINTAAFSHNSPYPWSTVAPEH